MSALARRCSSSAPGPMGLLLVQALLRSGASHGRLRREAIAAAGPGRQMGATAVAGGPDADEALQSYAPYGFDIVIDATGVPGGHRRGICLPQAAGPIPPVRCHAQRCQDQPQSLRSLPQGLDHSSAASPPVTPSSRPLPGWPMASSTSSRWSAIPCPWTRSKKPSTASPAARRSRCMCRRNQARIRSRTWSRSFFSLEALSATRTAPMPALRLPKGLCQGALLRVAGAKQSEATGPNQTSAW